MPKNDIFYSFEQRTSIILLQRYIITNREGNAKKKLISIIRFISLLHILYIIVTHCRALYRADVSQNIYTARFNVYIFVIIYSVYSHNKSSTKRSQGSRNGIRFPFYSGILATVTNAHINSNIYVYLYFVLYKGSYIFIPNKERVQIWTLYKGHHTIYIGRRIIIYTISLNQNSDFIIFFYVIYLILNHTVPTTYLYMYYTSWSVMRGNTMLYFNLLTSLTIYIYLRVIYYINVSSV